MADRANAATTAAAAVGEQKYLSALNILKTDIARAKSSQSKAGGEASQAYTRIEKMGVNKKGASFIATLLTTEVSIAEDVMRTVINLATAAGLMPREDLVDLADRLSDQDARPANRAADDGDDDEDTDAGDGDGDGDDDDDGLDRDGNVAAANDTEGDDDRGEKPHDTPQAEWDAAGEAAAAKVATGGRQPTPKEARAARKQLRTVPEALSTTTTH